MAYKNQWNLCHEPIFFWNGAFQPSFESFELFQMLFTFISLWPTVYLSLHKIYAFTLYGKVPILNKQMRANGDRERDGKNGK